MLAERIVITLRKLKKFLEKDNILIGKTTLWKLLRSKGFSFKKSYGNRKVLCKRPDLQVARSKYLREIREARDKGLNLVFYRRNMDWQQTHLSQGMDVKRRDDCTPHSNWARSAPYSVACCRRQDRIPHRMQASLFVFLDSYQSWVFQLRKINISLLPIHIESTNAVKLRHYNHIDRGKY